MLAYVIRSLITSKSLQHRHQTGVLCKGQPCLPFGQSDVPHQTTINIFCPNCRQVYFPKSVREANIEGAFFGTTFCHLFLLTFPEYVVPRRSFVDRREEKLSGGRIYGFRIGKDSRYWSGERRQSPCSSSSSDSSSSEDRREVIDKKSGVRRDAADDSVRGSSNTK